MEERWGYFSPAPSLQATLFLLLASLALEQWQLPLLVVSGDLSTTFGSLKLTQVLQNVLHCSLSI